MNILLIHIIIIIVGLISGVRVADARLKLVSAAGYDGNVASIHNNDSISGALKAEIAARLEVPVRYLTIRSAVEAAENGDTVLILPGEYAESVNYQGKAITISSLFILTSQLSYINSTIISGTEDASVITFSSSEDRSSRLSGLTITAGRVGFGGGVYCGENSSPSIDYCKITGNHAGGLGGGIIAWQDSDPLLAYCEIYRNSANTGAGLVSRSNSQPLLINCVITENHAVNDGGGIYCLSGGMAMVVNTIFWNNYPEEILFKDTGRENTVTLAYCSLREGIDGVVVEDNGEVNVFGGLIDRDPRFTDADNNLFDLNWNSPCIDAGTTLFVIEEDTLLNLSRNKYLGESVEIGAYEINPNYTPDYRKNTVRHFAINSIFPNPVNSSVKISFWLSAPGHTVISLYDFSGRTVAVLENSLLSAGEHHLSKELQFISTGSYLLELKFGKHSKVKNVIVIK